MEIRELYSVAKQESVPCSNRGEVSEDYILVKLGFSRAIGSRRSLDCPLIWEERTLLDDRQLWLNLPGVKMLSLSYRTLCTQKVTESLSSMRVPEDEHPNTIDRLFEALDSAISPELPINVTIWDMTVRFGGSDDDRAATESIEMYKPNLVPATRSSIQGLERVRLDGCEGQCVICLEDFAAVDQLITRLPCNPVHTIIMEIALSSRWRSLTSVPSAGTQCQLWRNHNLPEQARGELLKEHAHGEEGECCIFPLQNETVWTVVAISFIPFIVILIAIFAPRHWLSSRGRNQLPKSVDTKVVEALPCFSFSSARLGECHSEETCATCLENYKDAEILEVLPCQHEFHSSCVDSWLAK